MASTGALSKSVGSLSTTSAAKLIVEGELVHYGTQVAPPIITPSSGTFEDEVEVTITDATPGAIVHVTLDGTEPDQGSPPYTGPFTLED